MHIISPRRRRLARDLTRAAAVVSAAMLVVSIVAAVAALEPRADALVAPGPLSIALPPGSPAAGQPLSTGSATTAFALVVPTGAVCSGDTASGNFRVNSYIVPSTIDPSTLTWNSTGPVPAGQGTSLRQPLYSSTNSPFVTKATAQTTGLVAAAFVDPFSFAVFQNAGGSAFVPDGTYNIGIACTLNGAIDKLWNLQLNFAAVGGVLNWTVGAAGGGGTTTTTTTTTAPPTGGTTTTTTTTPGATTTTVRSTTTSSTSTTAVASAGATGSAGSGGGLLVSTGASPTRLIVWALLLLVFGRMAILLGRPVRVLPFGA